jgi:hypothetical protein
VVWVIASRLVMVLFRMLRKCALFLSKGRQVQPASLCHNRFGKGDAGDDLLM